MIILRIQKNVVLMYIEGKHKTFGWHFLVLEQIKKYNYQKKVNICNYYCYLLEENIQNDWEKQKKIIS